MWSRITSYTVLWDWSSEPRSLLFYFFFSFSLLLLVSNFTSLCCRHWQTMYHCLLRFPQRAHRSLCWFILHRAPLGGAPTWGVHSLWSPPCMWAAIRWGANLHAWFTTYDEGEEKVELRCNCNRGKCARTREKRGVCVLCRCVFNLNTLKGSDEGVGEERRESEDRNVSVETKWRRRLCS